MKQLESQIRGLEILEATDVEAARFFTGYDWDNGHYSPMSETNTWWVDAGGGFEGTSQEYPPFDSLSDDFAAVDFETVDIVSPDRLNDAKGLDNGYSPEQVEALIVKRGYKHIVLVCPGGCEAAEAIARAHFHKAKELSTEQISC